MEYSIGQLAEAACVSQRTLRHYEAVGLLSRSSRTPAGYRVYTGRDLAALQQILALKYLGFSLAEIRRCLTREPAEMAAALEKQRRMLLERRCRLDAIVATIERAQGLLARDRCDWRAMVQVIQVIQMTEQQDWAKKYFSEDALKKMDALSQASYSEEARRKLAARAWSEADQQRVGERWAYVAAESKRLAAIGADPAGEEAQALAKLKSDLLLEFTQGDPEIEEGLRNFWRSHNALPEAEQPLRSAAPGEQTPGSPEGGARLLERASEIYQQRRQAAQ